MFRALILVAALLFPGTQDDVTPELRQLVTRMIHLQKTWSPEMSTNGATVKVQMDKPISKKDAPEPKGTTPSGPIFCTQLVCRGTNYINWRK
jgi:hypothetical protein